MRRKAALLLSAILLSGNAWAEEVCFSGPTASAMVVEIERCRVIRDQVALYAQGAEELERQVAALNELVALHKEQAKVMQMTVDKYKELLKTQEALCTQAIEDAKPSFFKEMLKALGFIGIGILVGVLL